MPRLVMVSRRIQLLATAFARTNCYQLRKAQNKIDASTVSPSFGMQSLQMCRFFASRAPISDLSEEEQAEKARKREERFKITMVALKVYGKLYGDYDIPRKFHVPVNDQTWPVETWNYDLGSVMWSINRSFSYKDKHEELASIGIHPGMTPINNYERVCTALLHYRKVYGDLNVPFGLNINVKNNLWPESTWGLKLGRIVSNIRKNRTYQDKREYLESIGFDYSIKSERHE